MVESEGKLENLNQEVVEWNAEEGCPLNPDNSPPDPSGPPNQTPPAAAAECPRNPAWAQFQTHCHIDEGEALVTGPSGCGVTVAAAAAQMARTGLGLGLLAALSVS